MKFHSIVNGELMECEFDAETSEVSVPWHVVKRRHSNLNFRENELRFVVSFIIGWILAGML